MAFLKKALNKKMGKSDFTVKEYWFSKIKSKKLATKLIRDGSSAFFVIAGIILVVGYFISNKNYETGVIYMMISVVYAILAGVLLKWKSRIAAVLLSIMTFDALIATFSNRFGGGDGGKNIILALFVFWLTVRLVKATFKLQGKFNRY
jgi:cell division protein FtsW (lipid II flippase)